MFDADYYRSLSMEIEGLKNRVRSLIKDRHWPTDGAWKESVLRSFLRRHLPRTAEVGWGFIVSGTGLSTQIDVLICDSSKPVLFRDGDLSIVTPDAVIGVVEVKTSVTRSTLRDAAEKLADNAEQVREVSPGGHRFFGLFSYEDETGENTAPTLAVVRDAVRGNWNRRIDCLCLGRNRFIKYWEQDPFKGNRPYEKWRAYRLDDEAFGYFLHNAIEAIEPHSVAHNSAVWYPEEGKEMRCIGEVPLQEEQDSSPPD